MTTLVVNYIIKMTKKVVKGVEDVPLLNKVKDYRNGLGINQQELGALVGVSRQTISLIERGDYQPSIVIGLKLTKVFGVSVEEIFQYEEDGDEK